LLSSLCYKPTPNYFGPAQISVTMNDRGNGGDLPAGNGVPFEAAPDNLSATKIISLTINNVADPTEARPDEHTIPEPNPGPATPLTGNAVRTAPGANPPGDVADFDIDNDVLSVVGVASGNAADLANTYLSTGVGTSILGLYGSLVLNADGTYSYAPDARAQTVPQGVTFDDVFSYTISDGGPTPNRDTTTITIHITGTNDLPTARPDTNSIKANASVPQTGNVVTGGSPGDQADIDVDAGDTLKISGVQAGNVAGPIAGGVATSILGTYGSVRLNADGSYSYTVDTTNPTVRALNGTQTLSDTFSYTVCDSKLATATTTLVITINGQNDPPGGTDKTFSILEDAPPIRLSASDFGFTDPDAGDSFKAVRIDSLPVAASGVLSFNGVAITAGQVIPFASIGQIVFTPAVNISSALLGGNPGFNFSVCDVNGPIFDPVPNRINFNIAALSDPPVAPNEVFTVARDVTLTSPGAKLAAVQGPSDPDLPNDTLQIQVQSLPAASQGTFYRPGVNGAVPVAIGDLLTPAQLQQLCFVPSATLSGSPNPDGTIPAGTLAYKVTDVTGASATGSIAINVPANLPPVAPDQVFIVNQGIGLNNPQSLLNNLTDTSGVSPGVVLPSDPDQPTNTLGLTITSLPDPTTQGIFYRPTPGASPVPLAVGDTLTTAQLQQLQFVPASNLTGPQNAQGLLNAGLLTYVVFDGRGGSDPGSIAINVRPLSAPVAPPVLPGGSKTDPLPILSNNNPLAIPTFVGNSVVQSPGARQSDEMRLTQLQDRSLFDPFNPLAVKASEVAEIRLAKADLGKAKAERPQKEEEDCLPDKPKVKIKPKAVKRALAEEKLGTKVKNFSEMLMTDKKRMKLPVKLKPKPSVQNVC
jgi:VCBS repeat-containing protein